MDNNKARIIKISRDALFEFIYEKFIEGQSDYLDVDPVGISDSFELDPESGEFIFCGINGEDAGGNFLSLPKEIDLKKVMKKIPDTTDSMFRSGRYKEYTFDELIKLSADDD